MGGGCLLPRASLLHGGCLRSNYSDGVCLRVSLTTRITVRLTWSRPKGHTRRISSFPFLGAPKENRLGRLQDDFSFPQLHKSPRRNAARFMPGKEVEQAVEGGVLNDPQARARCGPVEVWPQRRRRRRRSGDCLLSQPSGIEFGVPRGGVDCWSLDARSSQPHLRHFGADHKCYL